ncbi:MAG TPA: polysaccharide deacetylase family protein [Desulfobacterales bacterium]|nr:polysaccharide deacetylase family protein [Desulfobacterales bacterium]
MPDRIRDAFAQHPPVVRWNALAWVAAALLALADARLAALPLGAFAAACLAAVLTPSSRFFLPVVSRGSGERKAVALTFDDGPDPLTTPALLKLLRARRAVATFFVTGERAARHPELVAAMVADGHGIGNHSFRHDLVGAFRSARTTAAEIEATQRALKPLGVEPVAYRPPMGITTPRLRRALAGSEMFVVNFSRRAWDGGNRRIGNLAGRILKRVRPGDIVLLHERLPDPARLADWEREIDLILKGLAEKSLAVVPLAELIGREVMRVEQGVEGSRGQGVEGKDPGSRIQDAG